MPGRLALNTDLQVPVYGLETTERGPVSRYMNDRNPAFYCRLHVLPTHVVTIKTALKLEWGDPVARWPPRTRRRTPVLEMRQAPGRVAGPAQRGDERLCPADGAARVAGG